MRIHYGFDIEIDVPQDVTILTALDIEPARQRDIVEASGLVARSVVRTESYTDCFGNLRRRVCGLPGTISLSMNGVIADRGTPDPVVANAPEVPVPDLPTETLPFLLASRYCEIEFLMNMAWAQFGGIVGGWAKVQAICDFVHGWLAFSYPNARATRTALESYNERVGVCRDFAHLAIALCRCMNIPARYCTGYLGDIGVPPDPAPMDFSAWFEAYVGDRWYAFDARHNMPRIGRIVIARGRDAADVPILHTFGPHLLRRFEVKTREVPDQTYEMAAE